MLEVMSDGMFDAGKLSRNDGDRPDMALSGTLCWTKPADYSFLCGVHATIVAHAPTTVSGIRGYPDFHA